MMAVSPHPNPSCSALNPPPTRDEHQRCGQAHTQAQPQRQVAPLLGRRRLALLGLDAEGGRYW
jgi:hypothetical protein